MREIRIYKYYFISFYQKQEPKVQEKIEYVLDMIRYEPQVPKKFFKSLKTQMAFMKLV